jgi:DNA-binding transcriptional ArsR family regulator
MPTVLGVAKALADETRQRALMALRDRELCLCQLVDLLGLAPSTVSAHLNILHKAGLVSRRKQGRWVYFRWAGREAGTLVKQALRWVGSSLADDPRVARDAAKLARVMKKDLNRLCQCYAQT